MWTKISAYYPPWLELISPLLLCVVFAYTFSNYPALPEQYPTHFGFSGHADAWKSKSFWSVNLDLLIGGAVWLLMFFTNYFLVIRPDDPGKYINLPQRDKEKLGPARLETIRRSGARGMLIITLTTIAMISAIHFESVRTALGLQDKLGIMIYVFLAVLFVESIVLITKTAGMSFIPWVRRY